MKTNRRHFARIHISAKALIEQNNQKYMATVVDISLNGAHLKTDANLDKTKPLTLQVIFDELSPPVFMEAKIVYHKGEDYGVECQEIDIDSMLHLRSTLTLYNSDPDAIQQESQALWEKRQSETDE
ncbi:PilZ domain-containing protein [Kangiella sediminilitoris]|nr:PilZ domain-containing protein [Kangiella sediminilitoris]